jgi:hypothetical protein
MQINLSQSFNSSGDVMLCIRCRQLITQIKGAPGRWDGPEPELFAYPNRTDTWTGAHHTSGISFVESVALRCYICNPLYDAIPREEQQHAPSARTFYEIRANGDQRWSLRFTIELGAPSTSARVIECHGIFKILPLKGRRNFHARQNND